MICTGALVSRQDICHERLGGGWRREQRGEDPAQALPPPQASPGLAQVHGAFLISLHSGASRHGTAMSPGDTPYHAALPSFVQSFPLFLSVSVSPSFFPSSLLLTPSPFLGHPLPAGRASRLGTEHFCVATAIGLNAGQHG